MMPSAVYPLHALDRAEAAAALDQTARQENFIMAAMLTCHSAVLLHFWFGGIGAWVGTLGALVAIFLSLLSIKAIFLLLFGLTFLPLSGPLLAEFRMYVAVYFIFLARLLLTPAILRLFVGHSPEAQLIRRWYLTWALFGVLVVIFYMTTANSDFGVSCAWDMVRGLGTAFLACMLATVALSDIRENTFLPTGIITYVLLGAVWYWKAYESWSAATWVGREARLGMGGGDPNAVGMILNVGLGMCLGAALQLRSWPVRIYAIVAGILALQIIIWTASRGAILSLGAMLLAALVINAPHLSIALRRVLIVSCFVFLAFIILAPLAEEVFLARWQLAIDALSRGDWSTATAGRSTIFYAYLRRAISSAFIGAGFNYDLIGHYYYRITVAHNTWLQIFSDFGLLGLALFIALTLPAFKLIFRGFRLFRTSDVPERPKLAAMHTGLAVALSGLILATIALTSTFEIIFWWCIGCAVAFEFRDRKLRYEHPHLLSLADRVYGRG